MYTSRRLVFQTNYEILVKIKENKFKDIIDNNFVSNLDKYIKKI